MLIRPGTKKLVRVWSLLLRLRCVCVWASCFWYVFSPGLTAESYIFMLVACAIFELQTDLTYATNLDMGHCCLAGWLVWLGPYYGFHVVSYELIGPVVRCSVSLFTVSLLHSCPYFEVWTWPSGSPVSPYWCDFPTFEQTRPTPKRANVIKSHTPVEFTRLALFR